jgi:uncharacterized protein
MKHWMVLVVVTVVALSAQNAWSDLQIGQVPETVVLQDKQGGRVDGTPWSSEEVRGKVSAFFYVDPDVSDLNDAASEAMKAEGFPLDQYQSFAVINMAATWKPNFAINSRLKKKQEQYPNTIYVRDNEKVLVEAWGISDENNCLLVFDKQGQLVFRKDGQLDEAEIKTMIAIIHNNLTK